MAPSARVDSIDALRALRAGLVKFMTVVDQVTVQADAEIDHELEWVRRDQASHWKGQVLRCGDKVLQAKGDLGRKRMSMTASGRPPSTVDEEKALQAALRRLEEARRKVEAVKVWSRRVEKERFLYRAAIGSTRGLIERELPRALLELDGMIESLDAYVALEAPGGTGPADLAAAPPSQAPSQTDARPAGRAGQDREDEPEDQQR